MLSFAPDYDHLPLIAKVEVFEYALQNTEGNDLARVCSLSDFYCAFLFVFFFRSECAEISFMIGTLVEKSHI